MLAKTTLSVRNQIRNDINLHINLMEKYMYIKFRAAHKVPHENRSSTSLRLQVVADSTAETFSAKSFRYLYTLSENAIRSEVSGMKIENKRAAMTQCSISWMSADKRAKCQDDTKQWCPKCWVTWSLQLKSVYISRPHKLPLLEILYLCHFTSSKWVRISGFMFFSILNTSLFPSKAYIVVYRRKLYVLVF